MTDTFVHLRVHSEYDIAKGVARLSGADSVIDYARELNQPALAITDGNCLFGGVKFYSACLKAGVKPIIGCELTIDSQNDHSLILLCADRAGYLNLNRLLSRAYGENTCVHPEWLTAESTAGLIALSGGAGGDIGAAIARGKPDAAADRARDWQKRFPDRFYIEIWRDNTEDNNLAAAAADIGRALDIPVVATHPVQCARPPDVDILQVKLCIASGTRTTDPQRPKPLSDSPHLLSTADMRARFHDLPGAVENSAEIARRCNFAYQFGKTHLPKLPHMENADADRLLRQESERGLATKLPSDLPADRRRLYLDRLAYELDIIGKMGFADYFLIVMDFIRWAKKDGIPVGPGRGSGAGSLAAYALDITTLDPLRYNLLFERFLNPERVSMPDFDIDFCVNGRDSVIRYVEERYGKDRVSQIVTFGTIGAKGAVRDAGRVLGLPFPQCDRLARLIPGTPKITLERALRESAELAEERKDPEGARLINIALKVEGLPRNIGTHAGGVLIAPTRMEEFCPKYAAADTNTLVSQYDMSDIERIGLVKFDFLGLRTLTILADAESEIGRQHDPSFSLENIPVDDPGTYDLYSSGDTIGVFQCESAGMRELMKKLKPDRFHDLIALVALYRPGPLNAGMDTSYIARKHGKEEVTYPHPSLAEVLEDTYGLFIYQEQVMEIARRISGYSLGEADILRRAMGKKDEKKMAQMRASFVDGSDGKLQRQAADKLFSDMAQFAEYGFNKSHAAAYALLSYRTAYIKRHYPAIFLAAVLSAEAGSTDRVQALIADSRRLGITIDPPDINASVGDFRATAPKTIRFGFKAIKGLGDGVIQQLVEARGAASYKTLFDFCARCDGAVPVAAMELLIESGAFDSLDKNRAAVLATVPSALAQNVNAGNLFDGGQDTLADTPPWPLHQTLTRERHAFGFPLSCSYMQLYEDILPHLPLTWRTLAAAGPHDDAVVAGNFVRVLRRPGSKPGVFLMADDTDEVEVMAPFDLMKPLSKGDITADLLIVAGRVFSGFRGGVTVSAKTVMQLDDYLTNRLRRVTFHCTSPSAIPPIAAHLSAAGKQRILLKYQNDALSFAVETGETRAVNHATHGALTALQKQKRGLQRITLEF